MSKRLINRGQAVGAILAMGAAAVPPRSQAQTLQRFKAAATPIEADSLLWLAQSQGYLQKSGLSLDIQSLGSGDAVAAAMLGGDIVIGSMNIISLALAHQNGVDLKIIAGCTQWESGHGGSQLMVKQDSPINGGAALSGKTIAINVLRGLSQMVTSAWIDKHGGDSTQGSPTSKCRSGQCRRRSNRGALPQRRFRNRGQRARSQRAALWVRRTMRSRAGSCSAPILRPAHGPQRIKTSFGASNRRFRAARIGSIRSRRHRSGRSPNSRSKTPPSFPGRCARSSARG